MGKRKYKLMMHLLVLVLLISCKLHKSISISEMLFDKENIKIILTCNNFFQTINEVIIMNENNYYVFERNDLFQEKDGGTIEISLDCSDKKIKTNSEYEIVLNFSGGYVTAKFFLGNPIKNIEDYFPSKNYGTIKVLVFDKSSQIGV